VDTGKLVCFFLFSLEFGVLTSLRSLEGLPFPNEEFDFVQVHLDSISESYIDGYRRHIKRIGLGVPEDKVLFSLTPDP